jgi:tRNA(Ile)-lysidine synthase
MRTTLDSETIQSRVERAIKELVEPKSSVLVAVSGGSDSLGLLHILANCSSNTRNEFIAGFVNHGLREGVDKELALVEKQASSLNIRVVHEKVLAEEVSRATEGGSIQAWARRVRYRLLEKMALEQGCRYIATAHTRDDQAETVLLRIIRGTGLDGLAAIPHARPLDSGVVIVRPLLSVGREEIQSYLGELGASWAKDPSNQNPRFLRTHIRYKLIPSMDALQPGIKAKLANLAADTLAVVRFLEDECIPSEKILRRLRLCNGIRVDYEVFAKLPRGLWGRVVREAVRQVRGDLRRIERTHIQAVEELIFSKKSTDVLPLPGASPIYLDNGSLYAFPEPLPASPAGTSQPSAIGHGLWQAKFAALGALAEIRPTSAAQMQNIELRVRRMGDRLWGSSKRFKEVLIRARIPRLYRNFTPVLAEDDQVISCPGILPSRNPELEVNWLLDDASPFLDIDFPRKFLKK